MYSARANNVYVTTAAQVLESVISTSRIPNMLNSFAESISNPNKNLRLNAILCVLQIIRCNERDDLVVELIELVIKESIVDRDEKVRSVAKKIFAEYEIIFDDHVERFVNLNSRFSSGLPEISKKYLKIDTKLASMSSLKADSLLVHGRSVSSMELKKPNERKTSELKKSISSELKLSPKSKSAPALAGSSPVYSKGPQRVAERPQRVMIDPTVKKSRINKPMRVAVEPLEPSKSSEQSRLKKTKSTTVVVEEQPRSKNPPERSRIQKAKSTTFVERGVIHPKSIDKKPSLLELQKAKSLLDRSNTKSSPTNQRSKTETPSKLPKPKVSTPSVVGEGKLLAFTPLKKASNKNPNQELIKIEPNSETADSIHADVLTEDADLNYIDEDKADDPADFIHEDLQVEHVDLGNIEEDKTVDRAESIHEDLQVGHVDLDGTEEGNSVGRADSIFEDLQVEHLEQDDTQEGKATHEALQAHAKLGESLLSKQTCDQQNVHIELSNETKQDQIQEEFDEYEESIILDDDTEIYDSAGRKKNEFVFNLDQDAVQEFPVEPESKLRSSSSASTVYIADQPKEEPIEAVVKELLSSRDLLKIKSLVKDKSAILVTFAPDLLCTVLSTNTETVSLVLTRSCRTRKNLTKNTK